jgi:hypothetical protein
VVVSSFFPIVNSSSGLGTELADIVGLSFLKWVPVRRQPWFRANLETIYRLTEKSSKKVICLLFCDLIYIV